MKTLLLVVTLTLLLLCLSGIILYLRFSYFAPDNDAGRSSNDQSWIGLTKAVYVIGEWQPYLKTVNNCTNFRNAATPDVFKIWPEPWGDFCCEDRTGNSTIASYVHAAHNGRFLHPIPYYDVGIVTGKTPYWTSWCPDRVSQKDITNVVFCEVNDLKKFYVRRYAVEALAKQGLLFSAAPFILFVELVVLILVRNFSFRVLGADTVWDLVHLCILGVNGSLVMENVGHSDPCGWEAVLLFNSAVMYTYLTALSVVSAVLHQVALWSRAHTNQRLQSVERIDRRSIKRVLMSLRMDGAGEKKVVKEVLQYPYEEVAVKRYKVQTDWQLQRMGAQGAVFFVASLYCTFVTVDSRTEVVAWLISIIILALVWSWTVGLAMLCKASKLGFVCYCQRGTAMVKVEQLLQPHPHPRQTNGEVELLVYSGSAYPRLTKSTTL